MTLHETQIPVLDISNPSLECANKLLDACQTYGFVFIELEGTNMKTADIDNMFELASKFFASTIKDKKECAITEDLMLSSQEQRLEWDAYRDFGPSTSTALNFGEFKNGKAQQAMPASLQKEEGELSTFFDHCREVCNKILKLFAMSLRISEDDGGIEWFTSRHDPERGPSGTILRLIKYPAIPEGEDFIPEIDIRAGAHSDYGSITLLFQRPGQEGLEILANGWQPVPVHPPSISKSRPPPILVNIGDLLSYWTGGLLKSTVHRVVFPENTRKGGENRQSMAFFYHPVNDVLLEPVPSQLVQDRRKKRDGNKGDEKVITALEHLQSRLAATYGWKK